MIEILSLFHKMGHFGKGTDQVSTVFASIKNWIIKFHGPYFSVPLFHQRTIQVFQEFRHCPWP